MTDDSKHDIEAPLDVPVARCAIYALQWSGFWCAVGLLADATWLDALLYGAGVGFCLGWILRVGILRFLWWKLTLRQLQLWRNFDWRRFIL